MRNKIKHLPNSRRNTVIQSPGLIVARKLRSNIKALSEEQGQNRKTSGLISKLTSEDAVFVALSAQPIYILIRLK